MHPEALKSKAPGWRRVAARIVPAALQQHWRELRELSNRERRAYITTTLRRIAPHPQAIPDALTSDGAILFVCYGNIIRSALAEHFFLRHAAAHDLRFGHVRSAGLAAKPGRAADPRAVAAGLALGVDLTAHRARPLSDDLVNEADVIYVMDALNEAQLLARFPSAGRKLRRLGALAPLGRSDAIADPYVLDAEAVASAAARIDRATRALAAELGRRPRSNADGNQ